jgi:predicted site-specific integrase-resolvase
VGEFLTSKEVCELLDIVPSTLCTYQDRGLLKAYQINKRMRKKFLKSEVMALVARVNGDEAEDL